ncbi:MAG: hypothetical protein Q8J70_07410, partial [Thiobacillus sp.]|nr:hypothetical protein [Thiobacillus sp.]
MSDVIKEIEMRIAAKRKELEDEEQALAVIKRMMGQSAAESLGAIKFEELAGGVKSTKKRTLTDEVRDVVAQFGNNEFTVAHIEAALKKMGVSLDAKAPRARIGIAVSNLAEEDFVVRTADGAG